MVDSFVVHRQVDHSAETQQGFILDYGHVSPDRQKLQTVKNRHMMCSNTWTQNSI